MASFIIGCGMLAMTARLRIARHGRRLVSHLIFELSSMRKRKKKMACCIQAIFLRDIRCAVMGSVSGKQRVARPQISCGFCGQRFFASNRCANFRIGKQGFLFRCWVLAVRNFAGFGGIVESCFAHAHRDNIFCNSLLTMVLILGMMRQIVTAAK